MEPELVQNYYVVHNNSDSMSIFVIYTHIFLCKVEASSPKEAFEKARLRITHTLKVRGGRIRILTEEKFNEELLTEKIVRIERWPMKIGTPKVERYAPE